MGAKKKRALKAAELKNKLKKQKTDEKMNTK